MRDQNPIEELTTAELSEHIDELLRRQDDGRGTFLLAISSKINDRALVNAAGTPFDIMALLAHIITSFDKDHEGFSYMLIGYLKQKLAEE